jgi:hypothetical protein
MTRPMPTLRTALAATALLTAAAVLFGDEPGKPPKPLPLNPDPKAPAATKPAAVADVAPPITPAERKQIDAAIAALSADNWKERQKAQDALVPFGQAVVPDLRKLVETSDDEEIRTRAAAALRKIDDNATSGGSVITLHLKDATPEQLFAAIAKQARCEFPTYPKNLWNQNRGMFGGAPNNAPSITVDYDRANFWTVFKDACKRTGVYPQQYGNDRRMTLGQGQSSYWNGPSHISGPFMIVANRIDRSNSVDLASPNNVQHAFSISLSAFAEPKVKVLGSSYNVNVDQAVDDKGNSLVATDNVMNGMSNGQQWMWNLNARLNYPENAGKTIKVVKGSVKFVVQTKSETLDIPDVLTAKNVTKTVANCRVMLKEVKKNGEQYDVQMTIYRDGMNQQEWNGLQYPGYAVKLVDKDGKSLSAQGWGGGGGPNELNYNWNFTRNSWGGDDGKAGEPARLVWEIPTETRETTVSFEFKDLPLP